MNPETQQEQPDVKVPSKDEVIKFLQDQIEVKKLQAELQKLNTSLAVDRADELEAYQKIKHFSNPPTQEDANIIPHTVTEEDIKKNPEFEQQGIKAGDTVGIPREAYAALSLGETKKEDSEENAKISPALSVVSD